MATVITNLLSAIPIFGHDIVELEYFTDCLTPATIINYKIKKEILPTIGIVSKSALKKGNKLILNKNEYLSIPFQFIAWLVGFIDGDGYIQITETNRGYIAIKLVIVLQLKDLSTLKYIESVLNLGKITINKDQKNPTCKLIISKTYLQEVLFPLLIHHNIFFLTESRREQFYLAMHIFKKDIKFFKEINYLNNKNLINQLQMPKTYLDYINLSFFKNWIVGFTTAEGSFFIKKNNEGCFQLKQRTHVQLFEAFRLIFETDRKIETENLLYNQFSVSSKKDIQTVINFFSFSGLHPLIGLKGIQYFNWLNSLRNSSRYCNLKFPE